MIPIVCVYLNTLKATFCYRLNHTTVKFLRLTVRKKIMLLTLHMPQLATAVSQKTRTDKIIKQELKLHKVNPLSENS